MKILVTGSVGFIGYHLSKSLLDDGYKVMGIDKELVGKVVSEIKSLKPVEPYKGKGIKEQGEYTLKKEGKKK